MLPKGDGKTKCLKESSSGCMLGKREIQGGKADRDRQLREGKERGKES